MRLLAIAVTVMFALFSGAAFAGKSKVAILKIDSDSGAEVQGVLKEVLTDEFGVVPFKETTKAAKALGIDDEPTDKDFSRLTEELEVDVVVAARLEGNGETRTLRVKLYVKGKKSKKFSVQFGNAKSEKFKRTMRSTLSDKISAINRTGEDEDEQPKPKHKKKGDDESADEPKKVKHKTGGGGDEEADEPKRKKKLAEGDEDDSPLPKSKAKKKRTAREEDDEVEESSEEEPGSELAPSPHAASRAAVRVDAGISAASRVLDFNARQYDQAPKDVPNSLVPGARVAVELYPFAFSNPRSPAAGLGLWGDFDKTISLTLQTRDPLDPNHIVAAKANQQRWAIGVGYRFAFTKSDLSPTVSVGINYAKQQFKADTSTLMGVVLDMPDTEYSMVQPVVNIRIPFAKPVALVAGGRGMLISDAGAITKGDQYGQAKVFGVSAMGGLDFIISNRFAVRVTGEFSQIGFTFTKGAGAKANNRDGDPNTKDVFGAADRSMGGSVTLGVLY